MRLTDEDALRAYAKVMNTLRIEPLEAILPPDFHYASQMVFDELSSRDAFLDYLRPKLQTITRSNATVFAEMGTVAAYGGTRSCVVLAQGSRDNLVGIVLATVESGQLKRLDLRIVPPPESATRSGDYPT